jgi:hypothetical protein
MIPLRSSTLIGIVAGFAGEETHDGHIYDIAKQQWDHDPLSHTLYDVRPRSVCVNASFPKSGVAIIFGGEVDPSEKGHEGAGSFANDIVVLDEKLGFHVATIPSSDEKRKQRLINIEKNRTTSSNYRWNNTDTVNDEDVDKFDRPWPETRGWADSDYYEDEDGVGHMYMFGGLTGDDNSPIRLNDLWKLEVCHSNT